MVDYRRFGWVSILILLDASLLVLVRTVSYLRCYVSILILLDASLLEYNESVVCLMADACFNPYFTGCFSFSQLVSVHHSGQLSFNPYFTGCFSFSFVRLRKTCLIISSVSILILLDASLLVVGVFAGSGVVFVCFNPYFTGCFSFRRESNCSQILDIMFQSLFYWMLLF